MLKLHTNCVRTGSGGGDCAISAPGRLPDTIVAQFLIFEFVAVYLGTDSYNSGEGGGGSDKPEMGFRQVLSQKVLPSTQVY